MPGMLLTVPEYRDGLQKERMGCSMKVQQYMAALTAAATSVVDRQRDRAV
jgi:hypothetical protein